MRHFVRPPALSSLQFRREAATNGWLVFFYFEGEGSLGSQKQKVMSFIKGDREIERKMGEEVDPYYLKVALKHPPHSHECEHENDTRRAVCCLAFLVSHYIILFSLFFYHR